ncbi:hypothetical protein RCC89_08235 [Cytophagaceae bacterium ABcell3]|nr:hypothetical protein RCC89_08235 [Cytophagaceae bacterium ABcell3]
MAISRDTLRVGKKYKIKNFGEVTEFIVEEISPKNIKIKSLLTLETLTLEELTQYGKGSDYDLREIGE